MSLQTQIDSDLKEALKAKDEAKLQTLRLLSSAIHNEQIAKGGELEDKDVQAIMKREVKKRKEAFESFKDAGRDEQAAKEELEQQILEEYLPEAMPEEEVAKIVDGVLAANPDGNKGQIIGQVMQKTEGRADGGVVAKLVNSKMVG